MYIFKDPTKGLKLLLIILVVLTYTVHMPSKETIKLYQEYFTLSNNYEAKILLLHNNGFGERETIERLKIVSRAMNIDLRAVNGRDDVKTKQVRNRIRSIINIYKPDFVLTIEDMLPPYPGVPNYLTLTRGGTNRYLTRGDNGRFVLTNERHNKFNALLISFKELDLVKSAYEGPGTKFFGFQWYPGTFRTNHSPAIPKKLFYSGGHLWDSTRNSNKYLEVFKKLDKTGYFAVCGRPDAWEHTPSSFIGQLPFNGTAMIEKTHEYGVSLILHHKEHLDGGAPTSRIFESAAANAVIISDRHPFIVKHFGNNVLYVDINQNAAAMFKQIDDHMQWIFTHPKEAAQMADNCHAISNQHFSLEDQMQQLLAMHKEYTQHSSLRAQIMPSTKINVKKLPAKLKGVVKNGKLPATCTLLMVTRGKYEYFLSPGNDEWEKNRVLIIGKALDKLKSQSKIIPDGSYLISYNDGVHTECEWPTITFAADRELVEQNKAVLIPDYESLSGYENLFHHIEFARGKYPWQSKTAKIFWRGQTTGHYFHTDPNKPFPRLALMHKAANKSFIDAAFSHFTSDILPQDKEYIEKKFPIKNFVPATESLQYKYLLDVDGHSCSYSRMAWILYSNSLLMKHTSNKIQWYYDKLQPYVHYVPVKEDFSDLQEQYTWAETHPAEVQTIINNGRKLAEQTFAPENINAAIAEGFIRYNKMIKDQAL